MQLSPVPPSRQPIIISPDRAAYRITDTAGFYGPDNTLYAEGEMIYWDGEPALCMEPMNELAKNAKMAVLKKLDDLGRKAANKMGKAYTGYTTTLDTAIELERYNSKQVQVIGAVPDKTPLSNPARNMGAVEKIGPEEVPLTGGQNKHKGTLTLPGAQQPMGKADIDGQKLD